MSSSAAGVNHLHEQAIAARPDDAFVRWSMSNPEKVFVLGRTVATWRAHHRTAESWLTIASDNGDECAQLVVPLLDELVPHGVTVPLHLSQALGLEIADRWTFWVTDKQTDYVPRHEVVTIPHDDPRLRQLLKHSPSAEHEPGGKPPTRWLGIAMGDELVSVGAQTSLREPAGHIAAVVTHNEWRGRGLALDVCATLLNSMLSEGKPAVCLGMWADNAAASSVYTKLGFANTGVRNSVKLR